MLTHVRTISSRHNPVVRTFRELAARPPLDGTRLLLDGDHLVQEARAAGLRVPLAAVTRDALERSASIARLVEGLERDDRSVYVVTNAVMAALSPVRTPAGIVAIVEREPLAPAAVYRDPEALVIAAVDVQDPGNVGAIVRAAEALGATGALVCGGSANPFSWKAVRGSMGSVLRLPVAAGLAPDDVLDCARRAGLRTVASVPRDGEEPGVADWSRGLIIFVGGEGPGLPEGFTARCDMRVTIPMRPPVESLNVAVSAALLLYEAARRTL